MDGQNASFVKTASTVHFASIEVTKQNLEQQLLEN